MLEVPFWENIKKIDFLVKCARVSISRQYKKKCRKNIKSFFGTFLCLGKTTQNYYSEILIQI